MRRGGELLGPGHRLEQLGPALEIDVFGQQIQGGKEALSAKTLVMRDFPQRAQRVAHAMERKGQQVEREQRIGQAVFAIAEIVLHVTALVLEQAGALVLAFPAGAPGGDEGLDIALIELDGGDEAERLSRAARAGLADLKLDLAGLQGFFLAVSGRR